MLMIILLSRSLPDFCSFPKLGSRFKFGPHFVTNLLPFSLPKSIKNPSKIEAGRLPGGFLGASVGVRGVRGRPQRIGKDFGAVLEPSWARLGDVLGGQEAVLEVSGEHLGGL